jgi:hypothetical protein
MVSFSESGYLANPNYIYIYIYSLVGINKSSPSYLAGFINPICGSYILWLTLTKNICIYTSMIARSLFPVIEFINLLEFINKFRYLIILI